MRGPDGHDEKKNLSGLPRVNPNPCSPRLGKSHPPPLQRRPCLLLLALASVLTVVIVVHASREPSSPSSHTSYLHKGTRLFMYMETVDAFDPAVDFPKHMELTPKAKEWGDLTASMQVAGRGGDGCAKRVDAFHLQLYGVWDKSVDPDTTYPYIL